MVEAENPESARWRGRAWVVTAYFAAFLAAVLAARLTNHTEALWLSAVADIVATLVIFGFSAAFRNSSIYDPYWSVAPLALLPYWIFWDGDLGNPGRQALVAAVLLLWGVRLTRNWLIGWPGLHHEDWRYRRLKRQSGLFYWPVSLLGIHLFPTVLVFLGMLPAWVAVTERAPLNWLDGVAVLIGLLAIGTEATADRQLRRWKASGQPAGAVMEEGLWAWSRHPNYLGEIGLWFSMWLFAMATRPTWIWTGIGVLAMALLFRFISIPMMEAHMLRRRPTYAQTLDRVPMLLPWFPRRRRDAHPDDLPVAEVQAADAELTDATSEHDAEDAAARVEPEAQIQSEPPPASPPDDASPSEGAAPPEPKNDADGSAR